MSDYRKHVAEDVRRIVLETLAREPGATLNENLISRTLESYGHRKTVAYVRDELSWLEKQHAIALTEVGGLVIATLLTRGLEHVERRALIPGVAKPALDA
ncbi:MAG: hypothetical protein ABL901_09100 [Hyphomicrobiaceae bacterium]